MRDQRVNPDLQEERDKCIFDQKEFIERIMDPVILDRINSYCDDIDKYPDLKFDHTYHDMTREEQIKAWWEKLALMYKIDKEKYFYNWTGGSFSYTYCHPGVSPLFLHYQMFQLAVDRLASDEQRAIWMPKINSIKMVGCYAQTELGHGSNVGGLETTATYDMAKDEFVVNSPTITSTKWWAGGLGLWANHAVVFARLLVDQNDYGVQPFLI